MLASTPPCVAPCSFTDSGYVSYLGGTPPSWQQITSEEHPCLVGFVCVLGGLPARVWIMEPTTFEVSPPVVPPIVPPITPANPEPQATAEPSTWAMLCGGIGILLARSGRRRA